MKHPFFRFGAAVAILLVASGALAGGFGTYTVSVGATAIRVLPPIVTTNVASWATGTTYLQGQIVKAGTPAKPYMCLVPHGESTVSPSTGVGPAPTLAGDDYVWVECERPRTGNRHGLVICKTSDDYNPIYFSTDPEQLETSSYMGWALISLGSSFTATGVDCPQTDLYAAATSGTTVKISVTRW